LVQWLLGHHQWGAILLCSLASLVVILPTRSNTLRTMFPAVLYLLTVLGQMAGDALNEKGKGWWLYPALFGMAAYIVCPQVPIYWKNHQVETLNRMYVEAAKETRVLYHCMDYNVDYTHTKAHVDGFTYGHFLMAEGFTAGEDEIYFYGTGLPKVYVNGKRAGSPALKGEGGNWLLPLRDIVEGLGGTVEAGPTIQVRLGDIQCYIEPYGYESVCLNSRLYLEDWKGPWHRGVAERSRKYYCTCISLQLYTNYLGLEVEFREDEEAGAFYVTFPKEDTDTEATKSRAAFLGPPGFCY
ncbi:MAG: hypothetical protein K2F83_00655, partial [Oscillospiraceae bacterium]|nr:hypothetical protein [Oscillospiraceae bacterium]